MNDRNSEAFLTPGAYSDSAGVPVIRQDIAKFISERDGYPCDSNHVYLSTGASDGIKVSKVPLENVWFITTLLNSTLLEPPQSSIIVHNIRFESQKFTSLCSPSLPAYLCSFYNVVH